MNIITRRNNEDDNFELIDLDSECKNVIAAYPTIEKAETNRARLNSEALVKETSLFFEQV
jgi:hypothetical protein